MSMFNKLKQIKDLRSQAKAVEKAMSDVMAPGASLGGKIRIVLDGNQKILQLSIDPSLLSPSEKEHVEDGIKKAHDDALGNLRKQLQEKLKSGDIEMPDLSSLKSS